MKVIETIEEIKFILNQHRKLGQNIGFVPTMGALHAGHISIIQKSVLDNEITIASIFVNPTQFGPNEDFSKYPRTLENDIILLEEAKCDYLFFPSVSEMYPTNLDCNFNFPQLGTKLCGKTRPNHFDGVCRVVLKLLNIIEPTFMYLGQKDFQQTVILKTLVKEYFVNTIIKVVSTIREDSGLALSSRNKYLSIEDKNDAICLFETLNFVKKLAETENNTEIILKNAILNLNKWPKIKLDYLEIVEGNKLETVLNLQNHDNIVVCMAAFVGSTRLIDNIILKNQ